MTSGIYQILNRINGKMYIGASKNIEERFKKHKCELKHDKHVNIILSRSVKKYGLENFDFNIIFVCDASLIFKYEEKFIDLFIPEYNIASGNGDNISRHPLRLEIRQKISETVINWYNSLTEEQKETRRLLYPRKENAPNWKGGITYYNCITCGKEGRSDHGTVIKCSKCSKMRKVMANHVIYNSVSEAAKANNVTTTAIRHRIKLGIPGYLDIEQPKPRSRHLN